MRGTRIGAAASALILVASLAACSSKDARPSKDEVSQGLSTILEATGAGGESELATQLLQCVIDKSYDDLSDKGLQVIAEGKVDGVIPKADQDVIEAALTTCAQEVVGGTVTPTETEEPTATADPATVQGSVAIEKTMLAKAALDEEVVVIDFEWTNATTEQQEFTAYTEIEVTQNGEALEKCYNYTDGTTPPDMSMKTADPGQTIKVQRAYYTKDHSDVTIRVKVRGEDPEVVLTEGTFPLAVG